MYDGPDLPSADIPEDLTGPEPQTVPLDVSLLQRVSGYETVSYYADGRRSQFIYFSFHFIIAPSLPNMHYIMQRINMRY